jgi:transglutaminase-like putative cysteine protease
MRYSYDGPIRHLRHRLIVIPRVVHGDQLRRDFGISVSDERAEVTVTTDKFSNCVIYVNSQAVAKEIVFSAWATVTARAERSGIEPLSFVRGRLFRRPTRLTSAVQEITDVGRELAAKADSPATFGRLACGWAHSAITYGFGSTNVDTSAAGALGLGRGVCQDYAHIMIAVCRAAKVPARYVSGHLTGEGGSHAWVEVLEEDPSSSGSIAVGFDPTHNRGIDSRYLTVAVGRDYSDVAPTSGTFHGSANGSLDVRKSVTAVDSRALPVTDFERWSGGA